MRPYISSGISPSFVGLVLLYAQVTIPLGNYLFQKSSYSVSTSVVEYRPCNMIVVDYLVQVEYRASRLVINGEFG